MSNKLYVFGCSYAWTTYEPRSWPYRLAKHFNLTLENKGFPGFGILQTFESWKLLEKDMKPGDMNVVCLSHPDRTYFFADAPFYSQLGHAESAQMILDNLEDRISKKIKKVKSAYIDYYLHLHRQEHYLWLVECWLRWLDTKSKELGTKTIVIPAFVELLPVLNGDFKNLLILKKPLMEISQGEYGDVRCKEIFDGKYDLRSNHLCISNHNVLLSKILDGIKLGYISDSMSDWHTGLIKPENFLIPDWHSTEFCYTKFDDKFFYPDNIYNNIVKEIINGIKSN